MSLLKKIHVHPLLWLVIAIAIATARFYELFVLLLIIFVHEMGHAIAAAFFSWRIKKISFLPFGGVAEMDEHGNRPIREEAIVIIAGPLQHVWLIGGAFILHELSLMSTDFFLLFVKYNLMVLVFNLLPIWPLDGGKLLFLLLSFIHPFVKAHQQTLILSGVSIGLFALATLIISPAHLNIWIVLSFLIISLMTEWKQRRYTFLRFLLERYYGKKNGFTSLRPLKVDERDRVLTVLEQFQRGYKHPVIVEKEGKEEGTLDENELLHACFAEKQMMGKVGDLLHSF